MAMSSSSAFVVGNGLACFLSSAEEEIRVKSA